MRVRKILSDGDNSEKNLIEIKLYWASTVGLIARSGKTPDPNLPPKKHQVYYHPGREGTGRIGSTLGQVHDGLNIRRESTDLPFPYQ